MVATAENRLWWHVFMAKPSSDPSGTLFHISTAPRAACPALQDARYSIGWFVWPKDNVLIQGPGKKYPPTTMKEFMKVMAFPMHACNCR